jgi:hypothetical protein
MAYQEYQEYNGPNKPAYSPSTEIRHSSSSANTNENEPGNNQPQPLTEQMHYLFPSLGDALRSSSVSSPTLETQNPASRTQWINQTVFDTQDEYYSQLQFYLTDIGSDSTYVPHAFPGSEPVGNRRVGS